jgi:hypothetical protein
MSKLKNPPKGSRLKLYVEAIKEVSGPVDGDWRQPGALGELAAVNRLRGEPRYWKHPVEFVRDALILPSIRELHGDALADALLACPDFLDEFTALCQTDAYRNSRESERRAPKQADEALALGVVTWAYLDVAAEMPDASRTARYMETEKRLGVDRNVIRRAVEKVTCRLSQRSEREWGLFFEAIRVTGETLERAGVVRKRHAGVA